MTHPSTTHLSPSPYPGLRPFREDEAPLFFGREEQTAQLLQKLRQSRFLAVMGAARCGKSSLVQAGLVASLQAASDTDVRWRIARMRPGTRPLESLTQALLAPSALGDMCAHPPDTASRLHEAVRRGPSGLADLLRENPVPEGTRLLLVVDPLEELFRLREHADAAEAQAFVALLLASAAARDVPAHVLVTMRTDYRRDCLTFAGLAEAMNAAYCLTPPMAREQYQEVITGPAGTFDADVDPALVQRLLEEIDPLPDPLPVLQHTLMRLWALAGAESRDAAATAARVTMGLDHYEAVGGLNEALSRHADAVFAELPPEEWRLAQILFRCLTDRNSHTGITRRPAGVDEVAAVAGVSPEQVIGVVERFRRPDSGFLLPPADTPLRPDTVLDIACESLIRRWQRLNQWVDEEAKSEALYRQLRQTALQWKAGEAALWDLPDLAVLAWKNRDRPTPVWASRYGSIEEFALAMEFIEASERAREEELQRREERRIRRRNEELERQARQEKLRRLEERARAVRKLQGLGTALGVAALLATGATGLAGRQSQVAAGWEKEAARQKSIARAQERRAAEGEREARDLRQVAERAAEAARKQTAIARANAAEAREQKALAAATVAEARHLRQVADLAVGEAKRHLFEAQRQKQITNVSQEKILQLVFEPNAEVSDAACAAFLAIGRTNPPVLLHLAEMTQTHRENKQAVINGLTILASYGPYRGDTYKAAFSRLFSTLEGSDSEVKAPLERLRAYFRDDQAGRPRTLLPQTASLPPVAPAAAAGAPAGPAASAAAPQQTAGVRPRQAQRRQGFSGRRRGWSRGGKVVRVRSASPRPHRRQFARR